MWPIGDSSCNWNLGCNAFNSLANKDWQAAKKLFIGVLMKKEKKKEKEKKKDNQYKLKKAMVIAIGLIEQISTSMHIMLKTWTSLEQTIWGFPI